MSQCSSCYFHPYFPISISYQCQILLGDDNSQVDFVCSKMSTSAQRGDNFRLMHNENFIFEGFSDCKNLSGFWMEIQSIRHTTDQIILYRWPPLYNFLTGMDIMMKKMGQMMNGLTSMLTSKQDFTKYGQVGVSYHFPSLTDMEAVLNSTQAEVEVSQ